MNNTSILKRDIGILIALILCSGWFLFYFIGFKGLIIFIIALVLLGLFFLIDIKMGIGWKLDKRIRELNFKKNFDWSGGGICYVGEHKGQKVWIANKDVDYNLSEVQTAYGNIIPYPSPTASLFLLRINQIIFPKNLKIKNPIIVSSRPCNKISFHDEVRLKHNTLDNHLLIRSKDAIEARKIITENLTNKISDFYNKFQVNGFNWQIRYPIFLITKKGLSFHRLYMGDNKEKIISMLNALVDIMNELNK